MLHTIIKIFNHPKTTLINLPAPKEAAKNITKRIVAASIRLIEPLLTILVVLASPLWITQRIIGSRDILILPHCIFIALIFIWVILYTHLLKRLLYLPLLGTARNA